MFPCNANLSASSPPKDFPITLQIENWDNSAPEKCPFSRLVSTPQYPNKTRYLPSFPLQSHSHSTVPRTKRSSFHTLCDPNYEEDENSPEKPLKKNQLLHPESLQRSIWMSRSLNTVLPFVCTRDLQDCGESLSKITRNRAGNIPDTSTTPHDALCRSMLNVYQQKKSLAEGMMDLALFSTNANQLRYELQHFQPGVAYDYVSIVCLSVSLLMQCVVGVGLILNSRYDVMQKEGIAKADKINNWTVVLIFLITVINVFIGSFGVATTESVG